jgi:hypothetical protein
MSVHENFWLDLHSLASSIERQGHTPDERTTGIIRAFGALTPEAQQEAQQSLTAVLAELQELHLAVRQQRGQPTGA